MLFENKIIRLSVYLESHEQCKEYKSLLLKKLKDNYERKAFEKYGIINKVLSIESIYYEEMMKTNPNIFFIVNTNVEIYFPLKDDKIELEISKILTYGIYLERECFHILIPSLPKSYDLKKDKELYYISNGEDIRVGSKLEFIISSVRYEKSGFHCLGKIIE